MNRPLSPRALEGSEPADDLFDAMEQARANLRTPLARYRKVSNAAEQFQSQLMSMERAKDERDISRDLHKRFVRPMPSLAGHPNALDFQAAERGRKTSRRIEAFCAQLRARMLREDEAFLEGEEDYFTTARVSGRV